ncbi:MAG: ATP-binding protein [Ruminiclostridium sp.]|nr:ATP-binding protein [Ruminiclostridium sp.]
MIRNRGDEMSDYRTNIITGKGLAAFYSDAMKYDRRDCFPQLKQYIEGEKADRVCLIYGLRRTGKTTMIKQIISELPERETAYMKLRTKDTMADVNADLKLLLENGIKYLFVDEVTLAKDFIDSASLFSDVFAAQGMKIILSGTDSLGFWLALDQELYDRADTIHTTYIPFAEHSRLLKINDIDEYIRYGGTLRAGEINFDDNELNTDEASFRDDESTRRYIDTAICRNIQNSLVFADGGGQFRHLRELYNKGELTSAINRIIENEHHYFLRDVLTDAFISHDLGRSAKNLRKDRDPETRTDILDRIDIEAVTARLMEILDIRNREQQTIGITDVHVSEIKEYLYALDLIEDFDEETTVPSPPSGKHTLFIQPGMRYCMAQALVHSLMKDPLFSGASEAEKKNVTERILQEVKGRMTEEIVQLETLRNASANEKVFKLKFANAEFDMVIYDSDENTCRIFEIKHSDKVVPEQARHLLDEQKCELTRRRFGEITERVVLYRGSDLTDESGVEYRNVEEYLRQLHYPAMAEDQQLSDGSSWDIKLG